MVDKKSTPMNKNEIQKANVIESYFVTTENVKIEVNIIDDEKSFVRRDSKICGTEVNAAISFPSFAVPAGNLFEIIVCTQTFRRIFPKRNRHQVPAGFESMS